MKTLADYCLHLADAEMSRNTISSIDTTRIYLRRSADEQRRYLDSVVDW